MEVKMLTLPAELSITDIDTLYQDCMAILDSGANIEIDADAVTRVDTASLQLLCALQKHLHTIDHNIVWHGVSEALLTGAQQLGLAEFLALQTVETK